MNPLYRATCRYIVFFVMTIGLCRVTSDYFAAVIVLAGILTALANKPGRALIFFLFLPFLGLINPLIFPRTLVYMLITRIGGVIMTFALFIASQQRTGRESLPLGVLGVYIFVSLISSAEGYYPVISYLKLFSFLQFIIAIYVGTRNLHHYPEELFELRAAFFAFCCIVILGSILVLPFPSVAYYTSLRGWIENEGVEEAVSFYNTNTEAMHLFSGVMNHSQTLAVVLACCVGWVFADMVIVEQRISKIHLVLLACSPMLAFLTRSRLSLLTFVVMFTVMTCYCFPRMKVGLRLRGHVRMLMMAGLVLLILALIVMQVRSQAFSRFIRKTEDVSADNRTAMEAFTATRMGAIENGLRDFMRNPIFGSGFQVADYTPMMVQQGMHKWYSSPIEKSLLPMIVLGESGLIGTFVFCVFLFVFYVTCSRKHYYVTISLFTIFLATNLGEGTFFSVNGIGGVVWILSVVGGFLIDLAAKGKVQIQTLAPLPPPDLEVTVDSVTGRRRIEEATGPRRYWL